MVDRAAAGLPPDPPPEQRSLADEISRVIHRWMGLNYSSGAGNAAREILARWSVAARGDGE